MPKLDELAALLASFDAESKAVFASIRDHLPDAAGDLRQRLGNQLDAFDFSGAAVTLHSLRGQIGNDGPG